jgi:DNA-binding beta-propeller fold protein YncE
MILLSKKETNNTYFDFDKTLTSGYSIKEDNDRITQKFANGNRKQFISTYTDVTIRISLDTYDIDTTKQYLAKLTTGIYKYYSIKDKQYKEATFIIQERPELIVENAINSPNMNEYQVVLMRAGD